MSPLDLVVRSRRIVTPGGIRPAAIHIRQGRIIAVAGFEDVPQGCGVLEEGDLVVMPGVVDTHVHVNEPGRADWEGFEGATRAAAAGGVTTIVDMPFGSIPPTTTLGALAVKRDAARSRCHVDVGFWGGLVPGNLDGLQGLWDAGVLGFKCVLAPSGVPEFAPVAEGDLREALPRLARLGATLLVHAELPELIDRSAEPVGPTHERMSVPARPLSPWVRRRYAAYLSSRPKEKENAAIELLIALCRECRARIHIVHLSSSDALTPLYHARASRLPMTVETCPHYLYLVADEIRPGATEFKCAPPIRERENREFLWAALAGRLIDMIVSDHSPPLRRLRRPWSGDFFRAEEGIASLQLSLPVVWTEGAARGYTIEQLAQWMCRAPARLAGLRRKGAIEVGYDADLVVWDPDARFRVDRMLIEHRGRVTPYEGRELRGLIERTLVRGQKVYERGRPFPSASGRMLVRDSRA